MRRSFCMALVLCCSVLSPAQEGDGNWFMAQTKQATVKSVIATSELVEAQFDGKYLYPPINILDGDFQTTWCEAEEDGPGIGESITVEFAEAVSFDEIQIVNGFATKDYYLKNNRVKKLLLTQVAGQHFQQKEYTLRDKKDGWQSISFDLPQTAQTITLKILDIYSGSKYDDTCLASPPPSQTLPQQPHLGSLTKPTPHHKKRRRLPASLTNFTLRQSPSLF